MGFIFIFLADIFFSGIRVEQTNPLLTPQLMKRSRVFFFFLIRKKSIYLLFLSLFLFIHNFFLSFFNYSSEIFANFSGQAITTITFVSVPSATFSPLDETVILSEATLMDGYLIAK